MLLFVPWKELIKCRPIYASGLGSGTVGEFVGQSGLVLSNKDGTTMRCLGPHLGL